MPKPKTEVYFRLLSKDAFLVGYKAKGYYEAFKVDLWGEDEMRDTLAESLSEMMEQADEQRTRRPKSTKRTRPIA
jgi:hypothetical protein